MSNWSEVNPHGELPKEAIEQSEAFTGKDSLPSNDMNTTVTNSAPNNSPHETTVFCKVTRWFTVEVTTDALVVIA